MMIEIIQRAIEEEDWRSYGRARRHRLLLEDDTYDQLTMQSSCRLQKYYDVAERVLEQFRSVYAMKEDLDLIYVLGNRLIHFLDEILPLHPDYKSPGLQSYRERSRKDFLWVRKRLNAIALRIDERAFNDKITHDVQLEQRSLKIQVEQHEVDQQQGKTNPRDWDSSSPIPALRTSDKDVPIFKQYAVKKSLTVRTTTPNFPRKDNTEHAIVTPESATESSDTGTLDQENDGVPTKTSNNFEWETFTGWEDMHVNQWPTPTAVTLVEEKVSPKDAATTTTPVITELQPILVTPSSESEQSPESPPSDRTHNLAKSLHETQSCEWETFTGWDAMVQPDYSGWRLPVNNAIPVTQLEETDEIHSTQDEEDQYSGRRKEQQQQQQQQQQQPIAEVELPSPKLLDSFDVPITPNPSYDGSAREQALGIVSRCRFNEIIPTSRKDAVPIIDDTDRETNYEQEIVIAPFRRVRINENMNEIMTYIPHENEYLSDNDEEEEFPRYLEIGEA